MLFDHPGFPEWFQGRYGYELPKDPAMPPGECEGCGASDVPTLEHHCAVCLAEGYGQARGEQRLADGLRNFVHALLNEPPDIGYRIVGDLLDTFYHATPSSPDKSQDTPDEQ